MPSLKKDLRLPNKEVYPVLIVLCRRVSLVIITSGDLFLHKIHRLPTCLNPELGVDHFGRNLHHALQTPSLSVVRETATSRSHNNGYICIAEAITLSCVQIFYSEPYSVHRGSGWPFISRGGGHNSLLLCIRDDTQRLQKYLQAPARPASLPELGKSLIVKRGSTVANSLCQNVGASAILGVCACQP